MYTMLYMQTTLADVLSALGAVPAGFRESTLAKLLTDSGTYSIDITDYYQ